MEDEKYTDLIELFEAHLEGFVEEDDIVIFEDTESGENVVDIYWIKPNAEYRPYSILVTCGMSEFASTLPEGFEENRYVELAMLFPMDWDFDNIDDKPESVTWPLDLLQGMAKMHVTEETWFGFGQTIDCSNKKDECFPGTKFNSSIVLPSIKLPKEFTEIKIGNDLIKIFSVVPIFPEELKFLKDNDANALIDKFNMFETQEIIDVNRKNTCK